MCYRNSVLIIFLIFKIIILVVLPILVYILYKLKNKLYNAVGIITSLFILVLIILRLASNDCVTNSNFSYFINNEDNINIIEENTNPATVYESIYSTETYSNDRTEKVYFYDINSNKIKNSLITCTKESYLKNYGDSISAITSLVANSYDTDIDMMEALSYLEENNLIDCENGINFDTSFKKLGELYNYSIVQISKERIKDAISDGKSVLVETTNKYNESNNFGCEKDYIVIYNVSNDDEYSIINPNDKGYSYFCPSNTIGYGSIIEGEQNTKTFTLNQIGSKALRYFVIEVAE